ncbi:hypothetical protein D3C83_263660 [compost metagenome]
MSAGGAAAKAAVKNGTTPAMAVEAAPARARWSGSQAPSRAVMGNAVAAIAVTR